MSLPLLEKPLFEVAGHYVTALGLIAFAALFTVGVIIARILQSDVVRRIFSRFKLDNNFIAIVTTILSLAALVFFTVSAARLRIVVTIDRKSTRLNSSHVAISYA